MWMQSLWLTDLHLQHCFPACQGAEHGEVLVGMLWKLIRGLGRRSGELDQGGSLGARQLA